MRYIHTMIGPSSPDSLPVRLPVIFRAVAHYLAVGHVYDVFGDLNLEPWQP